MSKLSSLRKQHSSALSELDMIECRYFGMVEKLEMENHGLKDNLLEASNLLQDAKEMSPDVLFFVKSVESLLKAHVLCKKAGRILSREELRTIEKVA